MRGMFQPIKSLLQSVHHVRILQVFKTWWLHNINFFLHFTVKKCTFHIHLIKQYTIVIGKSKHDTNRFKSSNWSIGLTKINTFNLCVALCNQSSLVPYHNAIFILLVAKYPLRANDIMLRGIWSFNKGPVLNSLEMIQFFEHSR